MFENSQRFWHDRTMGKSRSKRSFSRGYKKEKEAPLQTGPCPTPSKRRHANRGQAKVAKRQTEGSGSGLCVYRCVCGCWHVGTLVHESREQARYVARIKAKKKPPPGGRGLD